MIAVVCFVLFALVTVRSLLLMAFERKPWPGRILDFFLTLFFGFCASVLWVCANITINVQLLIIFAALSIPIDTALVLRIRKPHSGNAGLTVLKILFVGLLLFVSYSVVMMTGFLRLTEDQPVLKITMTGNQQSEFVEWKQPHGTLQKQELPIYEVALETPDSRPITRLFVYGDQVAVKAKVIRFRPLLILLGFPNLCRIEYVYNGYTTAERFNLYPHRAQEIALSNPALEPLQKSFWAFWENAYYQTSENNWIKSATLESNYFPLIHPDGKPFQGSYFLTITAGGLSATPLP